MRYAFLLVSALVAACRPSSPRPDPAASASAPAAPSVSASASAASAPPAAPASLELVATLHAPTLRVLGAHVSVSSGAFRASADGDGLLAAGDDLLTGLPYDPKAHDLWLAGSYPNVFAFRRNDTGEPCGAIDEPTVFVRRAGAWTAKKLARDPLPPHEVVAWNGGMLLVDSQIAACGWATTSPLESFAKGPGTTFTYVAADGSVSHPTLDLDPNFIALGASSTGTDLALVGTLGDKKLATRDIVVMRRHGSGAFRSSVIVHGTGWHVQSQRTRVREFGSAALVLPPPARDDGSLVKGVPVEGGDEIAYKGHASSIFVVTGDKTTERSFRDKSEQDCFVRDAVLVRGDVFAVVACPAAPMRLVRIGEDGVRRAVPLVGAGCEPRSVEVRAPDDLWVGATCGALRLGHPQTPLHAP